MYIRSLQLCSASAVSAALRGSSSFSCVCWSFTFSGVGVVWSQVCGPSCDSWVWDSCDAQLRRPDALASGHTLSFCHCGSLPCELVGRVRASVPAFFWWCSPSLVLGSVWRQWPLGGPGTCSFLGPYLGFSLSLPVLATGLRWLGFLLGCPPSVALLRRLLPWLFVRYLLACPHRAAVPLASWVLWCS